MGLIERLFVGFSHWLERRISNLSYSMSVAVAVCGDLTLDDWVKISGIALGLATFFVNWYYRRKNANALKDLVIDQRVYEKVNK